MKIIAVGDIMPGGILSGVNNNYVSQDVLDILCSGDIRVGTLETAIGDKPTFYDEKMNRKADVIYAKDCDLKKLKDLNIDIVSLANNHFFDLGPNGANHTIMLLDKLGIKHIGAGRNIEEAQKPVIEMINGHSVAFLAFCDWREETVGWCPFASDNNPGVNPMYDNYVVEEIKKYKKLYDYVVVMPHWGIEHSFYPTRHVYDTARLMRRAGADLILGGHTHRVQPVVNYGSSSVAYSMGNFLFPDRLLNFPRSTWYPEDEIDYSSLPETFGYPRYVYEPTYKHWIRLGKIGMIVSSVIKPECVKSDYVITKMMDRSLELAPELFDEVAIINRLSWMMRWNLYPIDIYYRSVKKFIHKKKKNCRNLIKRFLLKVGFINSVGSE